MCGHCIMEFNTMLNGVNGKEQAVRAIAERSLTRVRRMRVLVC